MGATVFLLGVEVIAAEVAEADNQADQRTAADSILLAVTYIAPDLEVQHTGCEEATGVAHGCSHRDKMGSFVGRTVTEKELVEDTWVSAALVPELGFRMLEQL